MFATPCMSIFKPCDIRGRYGTELTPDIGRALGRAVGSERPGLSVVVGCDVRPSSEPLKTALIEGLVSSGAHVWDVGVLPTPVFYFAIERLRADSGVMVTGSHNPPGDNGFKISLGPQAITKADLERLRRRVENGPFLSGAGTVAPRDVIGAYEEFLLGRFPKGDGPKVVVDAGNGCYGPIAPRVLRALGYVVVELFCEPDGTFPNRPPNPAVPAHLQAVCATVAAEGAGFGVAYDGDGDRVVFVDETGDVVDSEVALVLFARHRLREGPGVVVYDIKCSSVLAEEIARAGGTPLMEKSGHAFLRATLLQRQAVLGGEISGHFFFGELGRDDGLYATLQMGQVLRETGQSLATLAGSVPRRPITPDLRLRCPPDKAREILRELDRQFAREPGCTVSTLDGVRVAWADGWALARASVTEPLLTLRFEGRTESRLAQIRETVYSRVPALAALARGG